MTERTPCIDFESLPARATIPRDAFITVRIVARSCVLLRGSRRPGGLGGEPIDGQAV